MTGSVRFTAALFLPPRGLMRARLSASAFSGPSDARRMSAIPGETRAQ